MTQKPFTTDKGEFLAIEFPKGAHNIGLYWNQRFLHFILPGDNFLRDIKIPDGEWQIITPNASEATEEQAREIVDEILTRFKNYAGWGSSRWGNSHSLFSAFYSLESLLQHLGVTKTAIVLKKIG